MVPAALTVVVLPLPWCMGLFQITNLTENNALHCYSADKSKDLHDGCHCSITVIFPVITQTELFTEKNCFYKRYKLGYVPDYVVNCAYEEITLDCTRIYRYQYWRPFGDVHIRHKFDILQELGGCLTRPNWVSVHVKSLDSLELERVIANFVAIQTSIPAHGVHVTEHLGLRSNEGALPQPSSCVQRWQGKAAAERAQLQASVKHVHVHPH